MDACFELPRLKCNVCGYSWIPRISTGPKKCPECYSRDWDKENRADTILMEIRKLGKLEA
jgi:predicted Zn-ribbon and HTH transcriptional regulator